MNYIPDELRREVIARAGNCCEYCLLNQARYLLTFHVDHIIARRHRGKTVIENLCLCCPRCNINKSSDFGSFDVETNVIAQLFDPRKQQWDEHFQLNGAVIEPLTPEGRVTVFLLKFNKHEYIKDRERQILLGVYPCQRDSSQTV